MPVRIKQNERSKGIDLIVKINAIVNKNDLTIKYASGELGISTGNADTMFPDVILYGDKNQSVILQGWELKMPDVPIENEKLIRNAERKADMLGLNSFLVWNFTYATLYEKNVSGRFRKIKQWNDTSFIQTREDVTIYQKNWEDLLEKILLEINQYFLNGRFNQSAFDDVVSVSAIASIIDRNKSLVASDLKNRAFHNAAISAYINNWWYNTGNEYEHDEADPYQAYAKTILLNWANRIIFAHLIKKRQNGAMPVNDIDQDTSPTEANEIFKRITNTSDFFNVFSEPSYNDCLPKSSWNDLVEFSLFLRKNGIDNLDQKILQNILERTVSETKRNINGQYTTPETLADILVRITVLDWSKPFADCCCGTGTIAKAAITNKKQYMQTEEAIKEVWASDKNSFPLQVANISMVNFDTVHIANRIFQHNAMDLRCGETIQVTNPSNGDRMKLKVPKFGAIASNLPFVEFEKIPDDDKAIIDGLADGLDQRSDLCYHIALKIGDILEENGRLGIITSNSWMGTESGRKFIEALNRTYSLKQIHISGCGRWFKNAEIVTTLLILEKGETSKKTDFFLWKTSLSELENNKDKKDKLISSAILEEETNPDIVEIATYKKEQIDHLIGCGVSYNALFYKIEWLQDVFSSLIKISDVYDVFRGSRRGWDPLFFPKEREHGIETIFLKPVLRNARNTVRYDAEATDIAFCCDIPKEELEKSGYTGALNWIEKFEDQVNNTGQPLPEVLGSTNVLWYELRASESAEVFTMMNPDKRLFFAKFNDPSFINQRLIGLRTKQQYQDKELNFALLNSLITLFYIEASGFGRGLGVLDVNKEHIANCYMPNPDLFSTEDRDRIIQKFNILRQRDIKNIDEELNSVDRLEFENEVLRAMGIIKYEDDIKKSLLSMQKTRAAARVDI